MNEYDITEAFRAIENELIASMIRNMDRHRAEETKEGYEWSMWQAEQLKALEKYKRENQKKYQKQFKSINKAIEELVSEARERGSMEQEIEILEAIQNGFKATRRISRGMTGEFFKLNERKLEALIKATTDDMKKAETAILRMANDQYRKAIFNAQVYANSGAGTYEKAVDMATKDMLAADLNCIVYANGARHTLSDYADMAIRTASKRAYLQGEGEKRQEWGIATVIVNKRGNPCPKCLPFVGKVLIDDVWSGGPKDGISPETGKRFPLISKAIEYGLYHPRCKDSHTTYFEGISTADDTWTKEELEKIGQNYQQEKKQQYAKRQAEKYERLSKFSLDEENQKHYAARREEWKRKRSQDTEPKTITDVNRDGTAKMVEAYENNRIVNNLKILPAKDFIERAPDIVKADYGNIDLKTAKGFNDAISDLVDEYNTPLQRIVPMGREESFFQKSVPASTVNNYNMYSAEMRINQTVMKDHEKYMERVKNAIKKGQFPDIADELADKYVPTHEFAHTLLSTKDSIPVKNNWSGMDFRNIKKARAEVKQLYQEYMDDMDRLKTEKDSLYKKVFDGSIGDSEYSRIRELEAEIKRLKISDYAATDADEFLAEAFTDAKIGQAPSEYSKKVLDILDQNFKKSVTKPSESGIIDALGAKEVIEVHKIGKIDKEIYKCITDDIAADEVIITDERIQHILERHPNDYERYCSYLKEIVENPDYIIESNKPNTALILKEITESDEKQFKTVLRLKTSKDNADYKNSIITFMKINEKEWSRLIRNKQILYKRE